MYDLKAVLNELKFLIHWNMIWFIFPDTYCQLIIKILVMCASMSPETLYQFTGYSIVLRKREFILKCVAGSHVKLATAALHSSCTVSRPVFDKTFLVWLCEHNVWGGNGCQGEWGRQQMNRWETTQRWDWEDDKLQRNNCNIFYI